MEWEVSHDDQATKVSLPTPMLGANMRAQPTPAHACYPTATGGGLPDKSVKNSKHYHIIGAAPSTLKTF